jgi:uncharacterized membrane protein YcaP (DUF421 family)
MLFSDWAGVWRVIVVGALAYAALILLLRGSGKRTLSKMNAFDLIVTIALGSTLATVLLSKDVALAEGIAAFVLLIALQFIITWLSVRFRSIERIVKAEPSLLFFQGRFLYDEMHQERVTESEVLAAARSQGIASLEEVEAVVLETDGSVTVLKSSSEPGSSTLQGIRMPVDDNR